MAVDVTTRPKFDHKIAKPLFPVRALSPSGIVLFSYDVAPDGNRFLINTQVDQLAGYPPYTVILNWATALKK